MLFIYDIFKIRLSSTTFIGTRSSGKFKVFEAKICTVQHLIESSHYKVRLDKKKLYIFIQDQLQKISNGFELQLLGLWYLQIAVILFY